MPRIELCKYFHKIRVKGIFVRGSAGSWGWELVGVGSWNWGVFEILGLVLELVWNFLQLIINYLIKKMELNLGIVWEVF